MHHFNMIPRRAFLNRSVKTGLAVGLSTLVDIPWVVKRALAEGNIGLNGKKLLFIFLRGANDGLNTCIPILDDAYSAANRPTILIPDDPGTNYSITGPADFPINANAADPTYAYPNAIRLGNGFAALHPSLKFLAPVHRAGGLALIHRVGYPQQSRSHFDSQNYWETGNPNINLVKDGIFYRTIIESGLAHSAPLTGISIQSSLPLILRGSDAAMTNLTDPTRYDLLGIPNDTGGNAKAANSLNAANLGVFPPKRNRQLLELQYANMANTLSIFAGLDFTEGGNTFVDDTNTDNDRPYYLFPTTNAKNGGWDRGNGVTQFNKYVVPPGSTSYDFFNNLKAAALILNKTDAIIAGSQLDGFDTHKNQGALTGSQPDLLRRVGWAIYGLYKYFKNNGDKATWNNLVIVTLSEFGRTTIENSDNGTDHAEASVMFVAGGGIKGYSAGVRSGVYGCHPGDAVPWVTGAAGSMFGAGGRYLKRAVDYRSVLGNLIRDHLGATPAQLERVIPGYATATGEKLQAGGVSAIDGTPIIGEVGIV